MKNWKMILVASAASAMFLAGCSAQLSPADKELLNQALASGQTATQAAQQATDAATRADSAASTAEAAARTASAAATRAESAAQQAQLSASQAQDAALKAQKAFDCPGFRAAGLDGEYTAQNQDTDSNKSQAPEYVETQTQPGKA